jgi:hypothetical protein
LDHDGKIVMFPTQSCETWECTTYPPIVSDCVTNDAPTTSGLHAVLRGILEVGTALPLKLRDFAQQFLARVPPIPVDENGMRVRFCFCFWFHLVV